MRVPMLVLSLLTAAPVSAQSGPAYERTNIRRYSNGMTECAFRDLPALSIWVSADGLRSGATYSDVMKHAEGRVEIKLSYTRHADGRIELTDAGIRAWRDDLTGYQQTGISYVQIDDGPKIAVNAGGIGSATDKGVTTYHYDVPFRSDGRPATFGIENASRARIRMTYPDGQPMMDLDLRLSDIRRVLPSLRAVNWRCQ
jgi:hypothetical protein